MARLLQDFPHLRFVLEIKVASPARGIDPPTLRTQGIGDAAGGITEAEDQDSLHMLN